MPSTLFENDFGRMLQSTLLDRGQRNLKFGLTMQFRRLTSRSISANQRRINLFCHYGCWYVFLVDIHNSIWGFFRKTDKLWNENWIKINNNKWNIREIIIEYFNGSMHWIYVMQEWLLVEPKKKYTGIFSVNASSPHLFKSPTHTTKDIQNINLFLRNPWHPPLFSDNEKLNLPLLTGDWINHTFQVIKESVS